MNAASALETANSDRHTLQNRHAELNDTLDRLSGKADELDQVMGGYSATHGRLAVAGRCAPATSSSACARTPTAESERTLEDMRHRVTGSRRR